MIGSGEQEHAHERRWTALVKDHHTKGFKPINYKSNIFYITVKSFPKKSTISYVISYLISFVYGGEKRLQLGYMADILQPVKPV